MNKSQQPARLNLTIEQARNVILGVAFGDALGFQTEFYDRESIKEMFGTDGVQTLHLEGSYFSDDTQMTLALARALASLDSPDLEAFLQRLGREFVIWHRSPDNNRASGTASRIGTERFESGMDWRVSSIPSAKGCGSAMRVAPIGYLFADQPDLLLRFAEASSIITHAHPAAVTSARLAAHAVGAGLRGCNPRAILAECVAISAAENDEVNAKLIAVEEALQANKNELETYDALGAGWVGPEAIALALYSCCIRPDSYVETIRVAANHWGDSDTIAAIAGGIQAARLGVDEIKADWLKLIEKPSLLLDTADTLFQARLRLFPIAT